MSYWWSILPHRELQTPTFDCEAYRMVIGDNVCDYMAEAVFQMYKSGCDQQVASTYGNEYTMQKLLQGAVDAIEEEYEKEWLRKPFYEEIVATFQHVTAEMHHPSWRNALMFVLNQNSHLPHTDLMMVCSEVNELKQMITPEDTAAYRLWLKWERGEEK